jgi:hypothetical protein
MAGLDMVVGRLEAVADRLEALLPPLAAPSSKPSVPPALVAHLSPGVFLLSASLRKLT